MDICNEPCIKEILDKVRKIDKALQETHSIPLRLTDCEGTVITESAVGKNFEVIATALEILSEHEDSRGLRACNAIAAVPEWWQVRPGANRPQLVLQFSEVLENGGYGPPKYALTIPHFIGAAIAFAPVQPYQKGNYQGVLTLADNSKVIVNALTPEIAENVLTQAATWINPDMRGNSHIKIGEHKGLPYKLITVACRIARYFPTGQQNTAPEWSRYF